MAVSFAEMVSRCGGRFRRQRGTTHCPVNVPVTVPGTVTCFRLCKWVTILGYPYSFMNANWVWASSSGRNPSAGIT